MIHYPASPGGNHLANTVDPRFDAGLLCALRARGFALVRSAKGALPGVVDTGFPTLVTRSHGALHGMTPDPGFIHGVAAGW